jgi:hypothetical protein
MVSLLRALFSPFELKVEFVRAMKTRGEVIMTVKVNDDTVSYRGSVTVWRDTETGQRASTVLEGKLADLYAKHVQWVTT